jgi:hypothetical protein
MNAKLCKQLRKVVKDQAALTDNEYRSYNEGRAPHPLRTKWRKQVEVDGKLLGLPAGIPRTLSSDCWRQWYKELKKEVRMNNA